MSEIPHQDEEGNARMVHVGGKKITERLAVAEGFITMSPKAFEAVLSRQSKKGDVLTVAQLAGFTGAKQTSNLIPLCHPLPITSVDIEVTTMTAEPKVRVRATVCATWRTGVEMEALGAVMTSLLTVYDMLKAMDRTMVIGPVHLLEKRGGKSGTYHREPVD